MRRVKVLWRFGKKYLGGFIIAEICIVVSYAISVVLPMNLSQLTDLVLYGEQYELLPGLLFNYLILFILAAAFNLVYAFVWQYLNNHYVLDVKNEMFERVIKAKPSYLSGISTGDIMSRIDGDSEQFIHIIQRNLFHFVNSGIMCLIIIGLVARINFIVAAMVVVAAILPIMLTRCCGIYTERIAQKLRREFGQMISRLFEILKGFRDIKLLNALSWAEEQIKKPLLKMNKLANQMKGIEFCTAKGVGLSNLVITVGIYRWCVYLIDQEILTVGVFLALMEYVALLHRKFDWMLRIYLGWYSRKVSVDRVDEILTQDKERSDGQIISHISSIEFRDVSFSYDSHYPVLENISFRMEKGEIVGIIGESGKGKTTMALLMLGLYQPDSGDILVNNEILSKIQLRSLRDRISIVSQENILFDESIRFNLDMEEKYSDSELYHALEAVGMRTYVEKLPDKLGTMVSQAAHNLSGGQKQRIKIARILLKGSEVIILDEATSALDIESSRYITDYISRLKNAMIVIISHRNEALQNCDRIIELKNHGVQYVGAYQHCREK